MVLVLIGVDSYTCISYTKTAAVCTIAGLALMLHAMESPQKGRRALPVILGGVLAIFGAMLRFMEFLPCAALMSVLGLRYIWGVLADKGYREKARRDRVLCSPLCRRAGHCRGALCL